MYNEVIKIIEGGIAMDRRKVLGYAGLLADNPGHGLRDWARAEP